MHNNWDWIVSFERIDYNRGEIPFLDSPNEIVTINRTKIPQITE